MGTTERRIEFPGEALAPEKVAAHSNNEHQVDGFYLKEIDYPLAFTVPRHWHTNASLFLVLRGGCADIHDGMSWECSPSDVILMPRGETHAEHMHKTGVRSFVFEIEPKWLKRFSHHSITLDTPSIFHGGPVPWIMARVYREYRRMDAFSALAIEALAMEIACEVARQNTKLQREIPHWLLQARDLLNDCLSSKLTLKAISRSVGIHPVHLATVFRRHYGCTIGDYVRRKRVEFACRKLMASEETLVEIALAAGFSDQSHLSKTFKQLVGMSPSQFRAVSRCP